MNKYDRVLELLGIVERLLDGVEEGHRSAPVPLVVALVLLLVAGPHVDSSILRKENAFSHLVKVKNQYVAK